MNITLHPIPTIVHVLHGQLSQEKAPNPHVVMRLMMDYLLTDGASLNVLGAEIRKLMPYDTREVTDKVNNVFRTIDSSCAALNTILDNSPATETSRYKVKPRYVACGWSNFALITDPQDVLLMQSLANGIRIDLEDAQIDSTLYVASYRSLFAVHDLREQDLRDIVEAAVHSHDLPPPSSLTTAAAMVWRHVQDEVDDKLAELRLAVANRWGIVNIRERGEHYHFTFIRHRTEICDS